MRARTPPIRRRDGVLEVWGVDFHPLPLEGFVQGIRRRLLEGERGIVVFTPDARALSLALLRREVRSLIEQASYVCCDGFGISLAAKAFGEELPRVAGVDLAWELCRMAEREGFTVYLLGGREGVAEKAKAALLREYPDLRVVGCHHGYFPGPGPVDEIAALSPDLLLVGMGFPKQERWILSHRDCGAGALMGVGSTFDIWSGRFPRAPRWVREAGFEWLWRAFQDPRRLRKLWAVPFLLGYTALSWCGWRLGGVLEALQRLARSLWAALVQR